MKNFLFLHSLFPFDILYSNNVIFKYHIQTFSLNSPFLTCIFFKSEWKWTGDGGQEMRSPSWCEHLLWKKVYQNTCLRWINLRKDVNDINPVFCEDSFFCLWFLLHIFSCSLAKGLYRSHNCGILGIYQ